MGAGFGGRSFGFKSPSGNLKQAAQAQDEWIRGAADARRTGYTSAMKRWDDTFAPYKGFGGRRVSAWDALLNDPSSVTSNPGYEFRRRQGQEMVENNAAARGGALSGNALRAITEYGQDYASNEYDKALAREAQGAQFGATVDTNYANATAQLEKELGLSNAQMYGDFSNYGFWHEQQGMDEAKQWMGFLRGVLGGKGGNSGVKGNQTTVMGNQGSGNNSSNSNAFLSYYNSDPNTQGNTLRTDGSGNIDWDDYLKRGSMYLNY